MELVARGVALSCLIVDDNFEFLHAARQLLQQEGINVVGVASSGAEALQRVAELGPTSPWWMSALATSAASSSLGGWPRLNRGLAPP